jgi:hypothetical protein
MVTSGHKTLGTSWLNEPWFSLQNSLYLDNEVTPPPLNDFILLTVSN